MFLNELYSRENFSRFIIPLNSMAGSKNLACAHATQYRHHAMLFDGFPGHIRIILLKYSDL